MKRLFLVFLFLLIGKSNIWSQAPCPTNITISGVYTTVLTPSNSWIKTVGTTTIPVGTDVTLDANPLNNGYILLSEGFSTETGSVFLAKIQTGCAILGVNQNRLNFLMIYPNPTSGLLNIKTLENIENIKLFDLNGRLLQNKTTQNVKEETIDLSTFAAGVYLVEVQTETGKFFKEIVKK
jgi:hypothetical protein